MRIFVFFVLTVFGLLLLAGIGLAIFVYFLVVPTDPRYASPVSPEAAAGAVAFPVAYCADDRPHCEGHIQFVRGSQILLVRGIAHVSAYETESGRELWSLPNDQLATAYDPPDLVETEDGKYAFLPGGQVIDLAEGRIVFSGGSISDSIYAPPHKRVRRLRESVYRVPTYQGVYLVDFASGEVLPFAQIAGEVRELSRGDPEAPGLPRYSGPEDQTDDGALAVWITPLDGLDGPFTLSVQSRAPARELWSMRLPEGAIAPEAWIEGAALRVSYGERVYSYALRTGDVMSEGDVERRTIPTSWRATFQQECVTSSCRPGQWTEVDFAASADEALIALYETQAPERGIRMHNGYFTGSGMEAGVRRLRVTRGANGPTIFTRPMEQGRTTTRGYDTSVDVSDDHAKVAVLATDGVVRIYTLPPLEAAD